MYLNDYFIVLHYGCWIHNVQLKSWEKIITKWEDIPESLPEEVNHGALIYPRNVGKLHPNPNVYFRNLSKDMNVREYLRREVRRKSLWIERRLSPERDWSGTYEGDWAE